MGLQEKLLEDMKSAMKSGDQVKLDTVRMLRSQLKNANISSGKELSDQDVIGVLSKEAKKRKEAIELYKEGGREELAAKEEKEYEIIRSYLPEEMSEEALVEIIKKVIQETGAEGMRDMGDRYDSIYNGHHDYRPLGAPLGDDCLSNAIDLCHQLLNDTYSPVIVPSPWGPGRPDQIMVLKGRNKLGYSADRIHEPR